MIKIRNNLKLVRKTTKKKSEFGNFIVIIRNIIMILILILVCLFSKHNNFETIFFGNITKNDLIRVILNNSIKGFIFTSYETLS